MNTEGVDQLADMASLFNKVEGNLSADSYEVRNPRVQLGKDMGVLTYQLFAKMSLIDMEYNCIEVFQKEDDGKWYAVHSTWSIIRPMDKNFSIFKEIV